MADEVVKPIKLYSNLDKLPEDYEDNSQSFFGKHWEPRVGMRIRYKVDRACPIFIEDALAWDGLEGVINGYASDAHHKHFWMVELDTGKRIMASAYELEPVE